MRKRMETDHSLFKSVQETHKTGNTKAKIIWVISFLAFARSMMELANEKESFIGPASVLSAGVFLTWGFYQYISSNDAFSILKENISHHEIKELESDKKDLEETCGYIRDRIIYS